MSRQRRRGVPVRLYATKTITDSRGNQVVTNDWDTFYDTTAAVIPQRSSRAEIPGQQIIDIVRLLVSADLPNVGLWSQVQYADDMWDIAAPPSLHIGSRAVRHISIDVRRRPL